MTTGKNLAMTLFDLLDYHVKANPKYGSEKKGQPTTYYLSAAPEPIRVNCEYMYVDVVLSPDPNVFERADPLQGLHKNGVFIVQSALPDAGAVWRSFPQRAQRYIVDNNIRVFYVDAFKIARDEASDPELQFRMQGIAFQGAFFKASPVMQQAGLTEDKLFASIKAQLEHKFGAKGKRVVEDNLRVVHRGYAEIHEITDKAVIETPRRDLREAPALPLMLKQLPESDDRLTDIHRFWEQTGSFYAGVGGGDTLADPFAATSLIPASTGVFRDMTQIRFEYPRWIPEKCTACGECYTVCPDSAIPGLVSELTEVLETTLRRVERRQPTRHLRRALRTVEKKWRAAIDAAGEHANVRALLDQALEATIGETILEVEAKEHFEQEFTRFREAVGDFQFAVTKPYYAVKEKRAKGSGGLFSITVNPYTCKGCMECVTVCEDQALAIETQTPADVERLRRDWDYWMDLPTTAPEYIRIDDIDERIGALDTLLLDKRNYSSMVCGDGACLGCGEKSVIHLFTSTVTALMQPRVKKHLAYLDDLIQKFESHMRLKLAQTVDLGDTEAIGKALKQYHDQDLTLSRLAAQLDADQATRPIDPEWLAWATQILEKLKHLKWQYTSGPSHNGRAAMGIVNATGCTSVWGSTYPYNPYPFPWTSHLFQDSPSVAMGVFQGHMAKMADGFKAIRMAELELKGEWDAKKHEHFFTFFDWKQFSDEEFRLCPPVLAVGGDGAMYDIGFQNLSRMLMSGMPIKVLVLDTQVYSNTGGQACTSGFLGQVSDMAPYGKEHHGKEELRKEISLVGMAHRTAYVMQGSMSHVTHLLESFIEGLNSRRPALFNVYAVCPPEHGVADDEAELHSKFAVEGRAYPLFRYNPDAGTTIEECASLDGNPALEFDFPVYTLKYQDENDKEASLELPMTFAEFAINEGRFRKHFKVAPRDSWNDDMMPLAEFLDLGSSEREGRFPYIWTVDKKNHLTRVLVSADLVNAVLERRDFWRLLKDMVGIGRQVDTERVAQEARAEMAQKISQALLAMASGQNLGALSQVLTGGGAVPAAPAAAAAGAAPVAGLPADYEAVWIESPECTSCDECININPRIFAYDDRKHAYVKDPRGGPFKDIVRAAEKCTAGVIHTGTPWNPGEAGLEALQKRAAKYH
jgi:pyruvate-ferredoxin/flavodoxin oxidoreductase